MGRRPCGAPPRRSGRLLVRLAPEAVALFRFHLEAHDNLAFFTTLERRTALLKVVFSPQEEAAVRAALAGIADSVPLSVEDWPFARPGGCEGEEAGIEAEETGRPSQAQAEPRPYSGPGARA